VLTKLLTHRLVHRGGILARQVDQVDQHPARSWARARAPARALRGALDQAGDVGEDQLTVLGVRLCPASGSTVVNGCSATFGAARSEPSQKRRLSGVRLQPTRPASAGSGGTQLESSRTCLGGPTLGEARGLAGGLVKRACCRGHRNPPDATTARWPEAQAGRSDNLRAPSTSVPRRHRDLPVPASGPVLLLLSPAT
jgi:hypothetical protein